MATKSRRLWAERLALDGGRQGAGGEEGEGDEEEAEEADEGGDELLGPDTDVSIAPSYDIDPPVGLPDQVRQ